MAKFEQIARDLTAEILAGLHGSPGDRFMTVRELAGRFGVALTTAQKAVQKIKTQGLLIGDSTSPAKIGPAAARQAAGASAARFSPRRLGLVVTDITNPFFSRVCRDVQRAAGEQGFQVLVGSSESDFQRERKLIEGFLEIGVEGLLICPGLDEACAALYRNLIDQGVRLLFVSRRVGGVEADFVVAHNFVGGAAVAGHLLSLGYESFGYIGFGPRLKRDERLQGFRSALLEEGVELAADRIADGDGRDILHGYRAVERLFERTSRPRALFAFNDLLAIGALQFCQEQGIAVPDEVAIAGFDNLPQCRVTSPPLTSVAYPVQSIARLAVQNLVDRIEGAAERPPYRMLLEPHLVVRRSTDPQAKSTRSSVAWEGDTTEIV
ncbi:MAG TPA: substrate-binding domain-containing protein [Thermoguttaceae bacterium]|nr:substrate-binding domain-containing protein [Thermoguttaceae bacterium]